VRRCLEKKPERRFQSARDLAFALETLSGASAPGTAAQVVAPVQSRRRRWLLPAATLLIATVAIAAFFAGKRPEKAPPEFQRLTFRRGLIGAARFAPNGQTVIYSATWQGDQRQLYSTSPENPESRPLGQLDTDLLAISAAGEMALALHPSRLGFDIKGTLAQMPLTANAPRPVIQDVFAADWASDGRRLAIAREVNGRYRLEFPIGTTLYETARRIPRLRISPKGDWIAFEEGEGTIAVVDLAGRKKTLSSGWNSTVGIVWSPGGDEIWFTAAETGFNTALYAVTLAGEQRMVARVPYTLRLYDISRDGRVLLGSNNISKGIKHLSRGETQERDLSWLDWAHVADISTDGKMLLFSEAGEGGGAGQAVYLRKTDGSPAIRLGGGIAQALSPDGEWALTIHPARSSSEAIRKVMLLPIGAGEAKTLTDDQIIWQRAIWFPDGKRILLNGAEQGQSVRSYVLDLEGGKPRPVLPEGIVGRLVSPDGQWLIVSDPQQKLSLFPLAGGELRLIPGQADGDAPIQWSADGRSIYVHQDGGDLNIMRVYQLDLSTGRRELRKEYVPADPVRAFRALPIALTPDGKSYAYTYGRSSLDLYLVTGLK
jgi:Tol biopolymer transport system component